MKRLKILRFKKLLIIPFLLIWIVIGCKEESGDKLLKKENTIEAEFVRVVDGDTIVVNLNGMQEKVRLIGVDTPESKVNKRAYIQERETGKNVQEIVELGKMAKEFTASKLKKGQKVYLEFDVSQRDKYGRLLAYVWLDDKTMLNKEIICNGYAYPLTVPPNVKYEEEFRECFRLAREKGLGLFKGE